MAGSALVVEGGGMRGIFSAGACNLSSQVAGQYRRNYRVDTNQMLRPQFISAWKFARGGHYMGLDWLWETYQREDPLDVVPLLYGRGCDVDGERQAAVYKASVALVAHPPDGTVIHHIAPPAPLRTRRTSRDLAALDADYAVGHALGMAAVARIRPGAKSGS
jgi:predicted patatin/cPLA2 family phospholipase